MSESVLLVLKMAVQVGVLAEQLAAIAKRVQAGEQITQADIDAANEQVNQSVANWDNATAAETP